MVDKNISDAAPLIAKYIYVKRCFERHDENHDTRINAPNNDNDDHNDYDWL